jgi:hypothetical protein
MITEDNNKDSIKPFRFRIADDTAAKAKTNTGKLCECPGSKPGEIKIDTDQHLPGCRFRKRSIRYATKCSVIPREIRDGFCLGVVM